MSSILNATTTTGLAISPDNSGSLQLATNNGTTAVTIDSSQNVGIGTSSPANRFHVYDASNATVGYLQANNTSVYLKFGNSVAQSGFIGYEGSGGTNMTFYTANTERMRIDSSGNLLVGTTSTYNSSYRMSLAPASGTGGIVFKNANTNPHYPYTFVNSSGTTVGYIEAANTATTYVTSSDYRLKENIAPMTGALATVAQLKPVTYTWKSDGSSGQGFIAHELQDVVPDCVTGEKDAVETYTDENGNEQTRIKPQGVDTSFLVATLTAALQELKAIVDTQATKIAELEAKLEGTE